MNNFSVFVNCNKQKKNFKKNIIRKRAAYISQETIQKVQQKNWSKISKKKHKPNTAWYCCNV